MSTTPTCSAALAGERVDVDPPAEGETPPAEPGVPQDGAPKPWKLFRAGRACAAVPGPVLSLVVPVAAPTPMATPVTTATAPSAVAVLTTVRRRCGADGGSGAGWGVGAGVSVMAPGKARQEGRCCEPA